MAVSKQLVMVKHPDMYDKLCSDNPIDLCRYQVLNCHKGRVGLINSGGASSGASDLAEQLKRLSLTSIGRYGTHSWPRPSKNRLPKV